MKVEQIDDLPLLMSQIEKCNIKELIDQFFPDHGNWGGISGGSVVAGWLLYILSESDHRLSHVEEWADSKLDTLCALLDQPELRGLDFNDDRLGRLLDRISDDETWRSFELALGRSIIEVYALGSADQPNASLPVIRSDSFNAPQFRTPDELFRFGHTKHRRPDQPQCKVMVSALDPHAIPLSVEIVPGNGPDYAHYLPVIERARQILDRTGCLYVGDSHLGSAANRQSIHLAGDYYLSPLNRKQCSKELLDSYLDELPVPIDELPGLAIGQRGISHAVHFHELEHLMKFEQDSWKERRILCYSEPYAIRLQASFDNRINEAQEEIENLVQSKKGRRNPKTLADLDGRIAKLIAKFNVPDCFIITTAQRIEYYHVGKHKNRPAEDRPKIHLSLKLERNEVQIELQRRKKGWQVYASNAPVSILSTQQLVECYRKEYRIEHLFDYVINRDTGLLPLYLKKEHRVKALIRLLLIAMRLSCGLQMKVRRCLEQEQDKLGGIYPGNKGRKTSTPTTPMLLRAMQGISIVYLKLDQVSKVMMSELSTTQLKIIELTGAGQPYQRLIDNLVSLNQMRET